MLIDSLVLSSLHYALPVWGPPFSQVSINRLQRLQNWGVRITKSLRKYDHISHHLGSLSWLPVSQHIHYQSLCAMHCHYLSDAIPFIPPITFGVHHGHNIHAVHPALLTFPGADYHLHNIFTITEPPKVVESDST